uniref:Mitochondrial carrier protein n=1 Tax=Chrysotila carterae TaxID=13221 RepID=A0A7S4B0S3_CHRCT
MAAEYAPSTFKLPFQRDQLAVLGDLGAASVITSGIIVSRTKGQVQALAQDVVPIISKLDCRRIAVKAVPPIAMTTFVQFSSVRIVSEVLDKMHKSDYNLAVAYGFASVPFTSIKYNLLTDKVYSHFGRQRASTLEAGASRVSTISHFFLEKVAPGFMWSWLRDGLGVGGSLVLGRHVACAASKAIEGKETPSRLTKFVAGLGTGACTALLTQCFHNAALMAGRMTVEGNRNHSPLAPMRRLLQEKGLQAFYLNFPRRMLVIAGFSAVLNVTEPFRKI